MQSQGGRPVLRSVTAKGGTKVAVAQQPVYERENRVAKSSREEEWQPLSRPYAHGAPVQKGRTSKQHRSRADSAGAAFTDTQVKRSHIEFLL